MRRASALAVVLALWVAAVLPQSPVDVAITNAQVVDVERGRLQRVALITIADGRVTGVQTSGAAAPPAGATVIDASGLTLVPGLVDVSLSLAPSLSVDSAYVETQALRWGVTAARAVDVPLAWIARLAAREREGLLPLRLIPAAPRLNGPPPASLAAVLGATRDEAAYDSPSATRLVEAAARASARWIRVGPWTPPDVARAAIAAAKRQSLAVSVEPGLFTADDAMRSGAALLEGLDVESWGEGSRAGANDVQALARRAAAARMAMAPRLRAAVPLNGSTGQAWARDEDALLPRTLRATASAARERASRAGGPGALAARQRFAREFAARGGRLVIATGAGAEGWPVAGLAVLQEMDALVEAGVDTATALRAATWHGTALLGLPAPRWQAGMPADFVAVKGNPLTDLRVLRAPVFVMRHGERLEPDVLAKDAARLASSGR